MDGIYMDIDFNGENGKRKVLNAAFMINFLLSYMYRRNYTSYANHIDR